MLMSKSEFAAHIGVVPSRVTAMIASGIIGADALVGTGRKARIDVERALEQIKRRRNVGQALGNGLATRLSMPGAGASGDGATGPAHADPDVAEQIQRERLIGEQRKNRLAQIDEAARLGQLVPVEDMRREMGRALQDVVNTFTGMVPDIANAVAAQGSLQQRDLVHVIREVMNKKRAAKAKTLGAAAAEMPESVDVTVTVQ